MLVPSLTAPFFGYGAVSGVSLSYALSFRLRVRKEQNMKFRKTPAGERGTYVYRFNDNTVRVVTRKEVSVELIKTLHAMDDAEVYNNIKNSRPPLMPWQKKAREEWKRKHPGEEPEKNWNQSLDGLMETDDRDCSIYAKQVADAVAEKTDRPKEKLHSVVEELSEEEKELYHLRYTEEYSQELIAEMMGVSQNTISKRIRKLNAKLKELCLKETK